MLQATRPWSRTDHQRGNFHSSLRGFEIHSYFTKRQEFRFVYINLISRLSSKTEKTELVKKIREENCAYKKMKERRTASVQAAALKRRRGQRGGARKAPKAGGKATRGFTPVPEPNQRPCKYCAGSSLCDILCFQRIFLKTY